MWKFVASLKERDHSRLEEAEVKFRRRQEGRPPPLRAVAGDQLIDPRPDRLGADP
jgi:hypothetical protein